MTAVDLTQLVVESLTGGSRGRRAMDRLIPLVYDDLRTIAAKSLANERMGRRLQPSELVHQAYVRLANHSRLDWQGKTHLRAVAARVMHRVLVDHARAEDCVKRGGDVCSRQWRRITLSSPELAYVGPDTDIHTLVAAMKTLRELDERQHHIVELRFFGGMSVEEVAEATGLAKRTVEREWTMAKTWLKRELTRGQSR